MPDGQSWGGQDRADTRIAAGWGARGITSPTFTLIHEHTRDADDRRLYHIDGYRLQGADDGAGIGLEDLFDSDDTVVIEWAENVLETAAPDRLWVDIVMLSNGERRLSFARRASAPRRCWMPSASALGRC